MKVQISRIDKDLPLPKFETAGAVGFDLISRLDTTIPSKKLAFIPSNNIIKVPEGHALIIVPRSSMPRKTGLSFPHSIGVIDQDYCGDKDELLIQVQNMTDHEVVVKRGERIAQGLFIKIEKADWEEVDSIQISNRGGFGSTGNRVK